MSKALREIVDRAIAENKFSITGKVISEFFEYSDANGNWCWGANVHIGDGKVLKNVPVASNNRDVIYSQQNKGVVLNRMSDNRWAISGISKVVTDNTHYTYVEFKDDIFSIVGEEMKGVVVRPMTYGELGNTVEPYGYGVLPYGIQGLFSPDGVLIELVEWY